MIHIQQATLEDAAHLAALARELGYTPSLDTVESQLEKLLSKPDSYVYLARSDGREAGFISFEHYDIFYFDSGLNITGLAVLETHRRKGIGRALVAVAQEYALSKGLSYLRLNSGCQRTEAHNFYRSLGFLNEKKQLRFIKNL